MSITPTELLEYSERLDCSHESGRRTAVSRSYYAAYHAASRWYDTLPSGGAATDSVGVHERLIRALTSPSVSGASATLSRSIGYMLQALKVQRVRSDYDLNDALSNTDASQAIANARVILEKSGLSEKASAAPIQSALEAAAAPATGAPTPEPPERPRPVIKLLK